MNNSITKKFIALIRSIRPETTPIGVISVYIGGLVAGSVYNSINLILASVAGFFLTSASMTINDYYDCEIDKINHPKRPIPQGILTPSDLLLFSIILKTDYFIFSTSNLQKKYK